MRDNLLFYKNGDFSMLLEKLRKSVEAEINGLERHYLLKVSEEDLVKTLLDKYLIEMPVLHDEKLYAHEPQETSIDVRGRFNYAIIDDDEPHYVKGTLLTIVIPFEGEEQFFHFQPNVFFSSGTRGATSKNELHLTYGDVSITAEEVKKSYEEDVRKIKEQLKSLANMATTFNGALEAKIRGLINDRKGKILKEQSMVASLGIPIKRLHDQPSTYVIPAVRKKPKIEMPSVPMGDFKPEPVLELAEYEFILKIIQDMGVAIERSPHAYALMKEEDLRTQFLVLLNGHYEGQAMGEAFNFTGKTDILMRYDGKNVFIAECKFWAGEKVLNETIDQLLKYITWRDTKTAIMLFNRQKDFSVILSKIPDVMRTHACFKRELEKKETFFKYVFCQPSDRSRDFTLTVLAFNVPQPEKT